jgi:acyl carrier protein
VSEIAEKLRAVFVESLDLDEGADVEKLEYRGIEAWDSVGHMSLVAAIEDEFDVQLDTDQVIDLSSFNVALDLVTEARDDTEARVSKPECDGGGAGADRVRVSRTDTEARG